MNDGSPSDIIATPPSRSLDLDGVNAHPGRAALGKALGLIYNLLCYNQSEETPSFPFTYYLCG